MCYMSISLYRFLMLMKNKLYIASNYHINIHRKEYSYQVLNLWSGGFPMAQRNYKMDVEDYFRFTERYEVCIEYDNGYMVFKDGTPVILLGGIDTEGPASRRPFVLIANATKEEIAQLADFVASMRADKNGV